MTRTLLPSLVLALLLPTAALAQDFNGQYDLDGRYSNRWKTSAELTVTRIAGGLPVVTRTARFTSQARSHLPAFTWTSTSVRTRGRVMHVTFSFDLPGATDVDGLIAHLDPDHATRSDVVDALSPRQNVFRAIYMLSADGKSLKEVIANTTRLGDERWRWIATDGAKRDPAPVTGLTPAEFEARATETMRDWYLEWVRDSYADDLADATTDAERQQIRDRMAYDLDWDNVEVMGDEYDYYADEIADRYEYDNDPYLDASGQPIPRAALETRTLSMFPEFAGIGLSKVYLFDGRTGDVIDESDIID